MLGRLLEVTGGAQVLADSLINRFGEKRAPFALGVAALFFGFPIFFDAGLVVFLPIILTVARRFGGSVLFYALPAAGAFAAMHALVPPHPGPVAAGTAPRRRHRPDPARRPPVAVLSWYVGVYLSPGAGRAVRRRRPRPCFGEATGGWTTGRRHADGGTVDGRRRRRARARAAVRHRALAAADPAGADLASTPSSPRWSPTARSRRARPGSSSSAARQHPGGPADHPARRDPGAGPAQRLVARRCEAPRPRRSARSARSSSSPAPAACSAACSRISGIGEALTSSLSDLGLPLHRRRRSSSPPRCAWPRARPPSR